MIITLPHPLSSIFSAKMKLAAFTQQAFDVQVVFSTDDWFAEGANLLKKSEPIFIAVRA